METKKLKVIRDILLLVEDEVSNKEYLKLKKLKTLDDKQIQELAEWGINEHCRASDNPLRKKPVPEFIKLATE